MFLDTDRSSHSESFASSFIYFESAGLVTRQDCCCWGVTRRQQNAAKQNKHWCVVTHNGPNQPVHSLAWALPSLRLPNLWQRWQSDALSGLDTCQTVEKKPLNHLKVPGSTGQVCLIEHYRSKKIIFKPQTQRHTKPMCFGMLNTNLNLISPLTTYSNLRARKTTYETSFRGGTLRATHLVWIKS
jgi:hypothetical protein